MPKKSDDKPKEKKEKAPKAPKETKAKEPAPTPPPAEPKFVISHLVGTDEESPMSLSDVLSRIPRKGWKPNISKLAPAIVDGQFVVPEGERVIIEYTQEPSRDTTMWVVVKIFETVPGDLTVSPGHIRLYDPERTQYGCTNYKDAQKYGLIMKIPDKSKRWTPGEDENLMVLAKRHKRKKKFVREEAEEASTKPLVAPKPAQPVPPAEPGKKKRGRPKGSKNKSTLEREAREAAARKVAA